MNRETQIATRIIELHSPTYQKKWITMYQDQLSEAEILCVLRDEATRLSTDGQYYIPELNESRLIGMFHILIRAKELTQGHQKVQEHFTGMNPSETDEKLAGKSELYIQVYVMLKYIFTKPYIYLDGAFFLLCNLWRSAILAQGPKNLPDVFAAPTFVAESVFSLFAYFIIRHASNEARAAVQSHRELLQKRQDQKK